MNLACCLTFERIVKIMLASCHRLSNNRGVKSETNSQENRTERIAARLSVPVRGLVDSAIAAGVYPNLSRAVETCIVKVHVPERSWNRWLKKSRISKKEKSAVAD